MSLGYGFVKYTDAAASKRAIETMNGKTIDNKNLKVAYARPAAGTTQTNLYVANLDSKVTKEVLDQIFAPYGHVIDSKILFGKLIFYILAHQIDPSTRVSRGVAFVRYETNEEAEAAINALNGALLPNMASSLLVKVIFSPISCSQFIVRRHTREKEKAKTTSTTTLWQLSQRSHAKQQIFSDGVNI